MYLSLTPPIKELPRPKNFPKLTRNDAPVEWKKGDRMSIKCLMLETSDKRRFFTALGSKKQLAEYCRAFGAKTVVVRADIKRSQLMTIPEIVSAVCGDGREGNNVNYEFVKKGD